MERSKELSMDQSFLLSLKSIVLCNLGNEQFGAEELSREIGLSRSQVHRKLQKINSKSITQFIREVRLNEALELLKKDAGTSSEISYRVGFSSPAYFTKCFHEYFGYPPSEVIYRSKASESISDGDTPYDSSTIIPIRGRKTEASDSDYRKLTTIMFSDICGYTAIMEESEKEAIGLLKRNRKLHQSIIELYNGTLVKEIGDAIMASFDSPSDAVHCAQQIISVAKDEDNLKLHIGIHLGEVHYIDGDIFGDGVNIASRINSIAKEGEVLISKEVCKNVRNKENIFLEEIGNRKFKNVKDPIRVFKVVDPGTPVNKKISRKLSLKRQVKSPRRLIALLLIFGLVIIGTYNILNRSLIKREDAPKVTILPFVNSANDPKYEYLCDGLADGIISNLTSLQNLVVISGRASSKFSGSDRSYEEIEKELKVDHIVEGTFHIIDDILHISIQYVEARSSQILNSEDFDNRLENIISLQAAIAHDIASSLEIPVSKSEKLSMTPDYEVSISAYESFQNGKNILRMPIHLLSKELLEKSKSYFHVALQSNPDFVDAYIGLAEAAWLDIPTTTESGKDALPELLIATQHGLNKYPNRGEFYVLRGLTEIYNNDWNNARKLIEQGIDLNPNYPFAHLCMAWIYCAKKKYDQAIKSIDRAIQLDPLMLLYHSWKTFFLTFAGQYERSQSLLDIYKENTDNIGWALWSQGILYTQQGKLDSAHSLYYRDYPQSGCNWKNYTYGKTGEIDSARNLLDNLIHDSKTQFVSPFTIAVTYLGLDELDSAIYYLNEAYEVKDNYGVWLVNSIVFDPLRDDPRFQKLLDKMGLSGL